MNNCDKLDIIKAFIYMGYFRAFILFIPFNKLRKRMGKIKVESPDEVEQTDYIKAKRMASIINIVAPKTPWESKCLVQALTAQRMLKSKGISTTIYLGVRKEGNEMKAHAWLRCGEYYVTGGAIRDQYTVVAKFAN